MSVLHFRSTFGSFYFKLKTLYVYVTKSWNS